MYCSFFRGAFCSHFGRSNFRPLIVFSGFFIYLFFPFTVGASFSSGELMSLFVFSFMLSRRMSSTNFLFREIWEAFTLLQSLPLVAHPVWQIKNFPNDDEWSLWCVPCSKKKYVCSPISTGKPNTSGSVPFTKVESLH